MFSTTGRVLAAAIALALPTLAATAQSSAQSYPSKVIKIIGPAPPGGSVDIIARLVAPGIQEALKQNVFVENKGGGGGYLGTEQLSKAPADGYTIAIGGAFSIITSSLLKNPSYDPRDLAIVAVFASTPNMLVVGPKVKANSVAELIAEAKANPGKFNVGSNGVGTTIHLTAELFKLRTGTQITHVAYRGQPDAVNALARGETDVIFEIASIQLANVKAGKFRALAVAAPERYKALPDVPTLAETGVKDAEVLSWFGVIAPKGTSPEVIATLDRAFKAMADKPEFQKAIADQGLEPTYMDAAKANAFWRSEIDKWQAVIKAANLQQ